MIRSGIFAARLRAVLAGVVSALGLAVCLAVPAAAADVAAEAVAAEAVAARPGAVDGTWLWVLPNGPDGLRPTQSWHASGSTPAGDIFVAGMDHATNSALYRIDASGRLTRVGDARSASARAGNLQPGETFEKFHTRPTWFKGKVYVATMDYSKIDAGYLKERDPTSTPSTRKRRS